LNVERSIPPLKQETPSNLNVSPTNTDHRI
jgi:hypothetical protein